MNNKNSISKLLPVLFGFFIMGFVDVVGISTSYVKKDFELNDTAANLLPMMVFLWFLILSVPTGLLMNKIGRRKTVILSNVITFSALFIPFISYNFTVMLVAFSLLGIGNTLIQVSLNPLLTNVVSGERLTSSLTLGQFVKAIASFLGPIIAAQSALLLGSWKYIFPIFAFFTLLSTVWLMSSKIDEGKSNIKTSSFTQCIGILNDKSILMLFIGIVCAVGIDVGLNTTIPKFLIERCDLPLENASYGTSLYFVARTLGAFMGAIILAKISGKKYFIGSMLFAIAALFALFFIKNIWLVWVMIFILGFSIANVFPIIFAAALKNKPNHYNEISGLLIMGVSGGAFITFLAGVASDFTKSQIGGLGVLLITVIYLLFAAFKMKGENVSNS